MEKNRKLIIKNGEQWMWNWRNESVKNKRMRVKE